MAHNQTNIALLSCQLGLFGQACALGHSGPIGLFGQACALGHSSPIG